MATRVIGIIINVGFILLLALWVVPAAAAIDDGEDYTGDLLSYGVLPVVEVVGTLIGLFLIFRRAPGVRRFWLIYLGLYCVLQVWELLASLEPGAEFFFLLAGLGWLAYWAWAPRPRELQLERFWVHPEASGE